VSGGCKYRFIYVKQNLKSEANVLFQIRRDNILKVSLGVFHHS